MIFSYAIFLLFPLVAIATAPLTHPTRVPCPTDRPLVRSAGAPGHQSLSPAEAEYVAKRTEKVLRGAWKDYLEIVKSTSPYPLPDYVSHILSDCAGGTFPKLGLATSGGGYRAALVTAGAFSAFDRRNETAAQKTGTGGLLQAATYISALSGSAWTTIALALADMPTVPDLIFPPVANASTSDPNNAYGGFLAQVDLTAPGPDENGTSAYVRQLVTEMAPKYAAGFPVTIVDAWSNALARHFVNGTTAQDILSPGTHGAGILFSDIASVPSFMSYELPFPIVASDTSSPRPNLSELAPGALLSLTNDIWEFNAYEIGSWDPAVASFIPTRLLGSTNSSNCVNGFDQASFVAGVASNPFRALNTSAAALAASPASALFSLINATFPNQDDIRLDSAAVPNPFQGVNPTTYSNTNETIVIMTDATSDQENIPLQPMLVQARGVDTILVIDASADSADNFANGFAMTIAARRAALFGSVYPFPPVPATTEDFIAQNLTTRPTFFGCDDTSGAPLMIYIANGGPPASGEPPVTNTSSTLTTYPPQQVQAILDQSFEIVTQGMPSGPETKDPQWGACLACAVVDRARARNGAPREGVCAACLERYCWSGNVNGTSTQFAANS